MKLIETLEPCAQESLIAGLLVAAVGQEAPMVGAVLDRASKLKGNDIRPGWIAELKKMALKLGYPEASWDKAEKLARERAAVVDITIIESPCN